MNRKEHLLTILAEECAEVAQRVSKALRFGLHEAEPGQSKTNAERIVDELLDMQALVEMLTQDGHLTNPGFAYQDRAMNAKITKVENYLDYSEDMGTLTNETDDRGEDDPFGQLVETLRRTQTPVQVTDLSKTFAGDSGPYAWPDFHSGKPYASDTVSIRSPF